MKKDKFDFEDNRQVVCVRSHVASLLLSSLWLLLISQEQQVTNKFVIAPRKQSLRPF